jgi:hypothetical protein
MAKEVVLVPREKYQKLLKDRMILNNQCKTNPSELVGVCEEKKNITDLNDINLETDSHNNEKSQSDKEHRDKAVNQHLNKRKLNDLQVVNTEEISESEHHDTNNGKASVNQSETLQTIDVHSDKSDDSTIKLAVRSMPTSIVNRQETSTSRRRAYRKKWLKYK